MKQFAKMQILRLLREAGYVLLKTKHYEQLLMQPAPSPPALPPVLSAPLPAAPEFGAPLWNDGSDVGQYLHQAAAVSDLSALRLLTIRSAIRYLVRAGIPGDIVDCGIGAPHTLSAVSTALLELGDTTRRLLLFDSSADPRNRTELEFVLW